MKNFTFNCGCSFPILKDADEKYKLPLLDFDIENVPEDCPSTWEMLGRGDTKGVFQLESSLGRGWCKKLKPEHLEHMGALGSLLRPGCLNAKDENGISMTEHYSLRKNHLEEAQPYHPVVDKILSDTHFVLTYQEQIMALGKELAGFDLVAVDKLRKAVGKKDQKALAKVGEEFIAGCEKQKVVSKEQAAEIWEWIRAAGRYSFNKSHAISYGIIGYQTAYLKAHGPIQMFTSWLDTAKGKIDPQQEVYELVNEAKLFDIDVLTPDLRDLEAHFHTNGEVIKFGLCDIKGIGESQLEKLKVAVIETEKILSKSINDWTWKEFLLYHGLYFAPSAVIKLIEAGAMNWIDKDKIGRQPMLTEFNAWNKLTDKEQSWFREQIKNDKDSICDLLKFGARPKKEGGACANKNRVTNMLSVADLLENPPTVVVDTPNYIADKEKDLLGISLTNFKTDSCDISEVNCTCKEYLCGREGYLVFGVEVQDIREIKTKRGKTPGATMAYLSVSDGTAVMQDVVCFPDVWSQHSSLLIPENTVIIQGQRDHKNGTLIVKNAWQMS